jgi:integrase
MTTFAYEVSGFRRKDGTHLVKIRMTHRRKVVRKPTPVYVTRDQLTRDGKRVKDAAVLAAIDRHLSKLRTAVANIEGAEWMDADRLWDVLTERTAEEKGFRLDVYDFAERMTEGKEQRTRLGYKYTLNALRKFTGRDRLDINEVTYELLVAWKAWMEARSGKGSRSVSYYLEHLKTIHTEARSLYNDDDVGVVRIPRQPFRKGLIPPQPKTKHKALTAEQVRQIAACEPTTSRGKLAKDVFLLSFALVGMNTVDLYHLKKGDVKDGVLTYCRAKTDSKRDDKALMKVRVEPEAAAIIERRKGMGGNLLMFATRYGTDSEFNRAMNIGLKEVGKLCKIEKLTTYHARHTWATLARNDVGVTLGDVGEALNHSPRGSDRVTDIYVERDFSRVWETNRKVLDLVFGK